MNERYYPLRTADNWWLPIPNYDNNYEISKDGLIRRVYSDGTVRELSQQSSNGSFIIKLSLNGKKRTESIARLVAITFLNMPSDMIAYHKNGITSDNNIHNIAFASIQDVGAIFASAKRKPVEKIDRSGDVVETYKSVKIAAKTNYKSESSIIKICTKCNYDENGFSYRYA